MAAVVLDSVSVQRDSELVVDGVSFVAAEGSLTVVVGSSGAGKTSLLRAIAGLDPLSGGAIRIGGRDMAGVPPGERDVAMTFQDPPLFRTRDVAGNIAFPLEMRRAAADQIAERVGVEARVLHIDRLLTRDVDRLSAGEAQLVQLARAMVHTPAVLLVDEPFAALGGDGAELIRREMALMQRAFGVTTLLATNDPHDVIRGADLVVVLERGRLVQVGTPSEVYDRPATATAAKLTGDAELLRVVVERDADGAWLVHTAFRVRAWQPALRRLGGRRLQMVTRPEWWAIDPNGLIHGVVERVTPWSAGTIVVCDVGGYRIPVRLPPGQRPPAELVVGSPVGLRLDRWVLLDPRDGRRTELEA
jgi:ABC-type sugar transport system ATPase subunit